MADPETSPTAGDEPPWLKSMRRSLPVVLIVLIVSISVGFTYKSVNRNTFRLYDSCVEGVRVVVGGPCLPGPRP
jgi:hypothetical protein